MYILRSIVKEFVKEFYGNLMQGYNGAIVLVIRLQEEYVINGIYGITREVIKECLDCKRNKFNRHKLYKELWLVEILSRL